MMLVPLLTALAPFVAQDAPAPKTTPTTATSPAQAAKPTVTMRADLARAYVRFETTLHDHPPAPERWPEINRAFDALTLDFFMGKGSAAIAKLDGLTESVRGRVPTIVEATTLRLAWTEVHGDNPRLQLQVGTRAPNADESRLAPPELVFRSWWMDTAALLEPADRPVDEITWPLGDFVGAPIRSLSLDETARIVRAWDRAPACDAWSSDTNPSWGWFVRVHHELVPLGGTFLETPGFRARRAHLDDAVSRLTADGPPMEQALASLRARLRLLHEPEASESTAILRLDRHQLAARVEFETEWFAAGEDPYRRAADDHWRVVRVGDKDVPVRVFAPPPPRAGPRPLVVALHGAGGDENMFFDGYGAGRIKALATDRDFVCVTPRVGFTGLSGETFDAIVRAMIYDHAIDPKRIYVLGHSMGAGAAYSLAVSRADTIAAVACVAGGAQGAPPTSIAPLLVVAGELDPIVNASGLEQGSQRLKAAGLPVEYQLVKGFGHTLVVGEKLPAVVDWLLTHTR